MGKIYTKNIDIYYIDEENEEHLLPYAFYASKPKFRWTLPDGVSQESFIFEMRTMYPKNYDVLGEAVHRCAYLYSGIQETSLTEYECFKSITHKEVDGVLTQIDTWHGACEVRLRIFGSDGNEYGTHGVSPDGTVYDFEITETGEPNNQHRYWGSRNDSYYFCFDNSIDKGMNSDAGIISFTRSTDYDNDELTYELQVADTPLFSDGTKGNAFFDVNGISISDTQAHIIALFSNNNSSGIVLEYGKLYYSRVRAYDGLDYSDWCNVKAFRMVDNKVPECVILDVYAPFSIDNRGNAVQEPRPNGEMMVKFRINDADNKYVTAWMLFSMPVSEAEATLLTNADNNGGISQEPIVQTVEKNASTEPIEIYDSETRGKFMRAVTNESMTHVPTNTDIIVTWRTVTDINGSVMKDKVINDGTLYLYLFADDGDSVIKSSAYRVMNLDNSGMGGESAIGNMAVGYRIHGNTTWHLRFPVVPEDMLRQFIVNTLPADDESNPGEEEESYGSIGYTDNLVGECDSIEYDERTGEIIHGKTRVSDFHNIFEFLSKCDDAMKYNYLQRITQNSGFTIYRYKKYNTFYEDYTEYIQTNPNTYTYGAEGINTYVRGIGLPTVYDENGKIIVYDEDGNPIPSEGMAEESPYFDFDEVECNGFVSFCPYCNDLHILKSVIKVRKWDSVQRKYRDMIYETLQDAFTDSEGRQNYDGTPYELMFRCDGCGNAFTMDTKYQKNLSFGTNGMFVKKNYSHWHGYNSDEKHLDNEPMQRQLMLTRENDFEDIKERWKEQWRKEHGGSEPREDDCPYTWQKTCTIDGENFGLMPSDALLKLNPRPEFDSYSKVIPPDAKPYEDRIYSDGAKLNASINLDYMHDFESSSDEEGEHEGDKDLIALAKQSPWWYQPRMTYHFFEGRKSIEKEKEGYPSVYSGQDDESERDEDEGSEEEITEYRMCSYSGENDDSSEKSVKCVEIGSKSDEHPVSMIVNRMTCSGVIKFPVIIERGVNDRYVNRINDTTVSEGSVLPEGIDRIFIDFPYTMTTSSMEGRTTRHYTVITSAANEMMSVLSRIFSPAFYVLDSQYSGETDIFRDFTRDENGSFIPYSNDNGENVDVDNNTVSFTLYGNTSFGVESLHSRRYDKFELFTCDNDCYGVISVVPFVTYQHFVQVFGLSKTNEGYVPLVKNDQFPENPYVEGENPSGNSRTYYYTERSTTVHNYHVQESPIDNCVEDFTPFELVVEGREEHLKGKFREISKTPANGEPLFTCYKDEVDENGYHFKFTEEDYRRTGKIYIRKYHVETCNPFPMEGYGYRNWIALPIKGKDGRYVKKQVFNTRGVMAEPRYILVELETGEDPVVEIGWFKPDGDSYDPSGGEIYVGDSDPFSHDRRDEESSSDEEERVPRIYRRKQSYEWRNAMMPKTCVVFDYVDVSEALCKNPFTPEGKSPLNHVAPVNMNAGIFDEFVDRYGVYVMGGYDLTDDQKLLENDGIGYIKELPWTDRSSGITRMVNVYLPNNWTTESIRGVFDTVEAEKRTIKCVNLNMKKTSSSSEEEKMYDIKNVDSFERFKKAWKGKIPAPESSCELSQYTVEQFNPAFRSFVGIFKKYGYQPYHHVEDYWKEDSEGAYDDRYIPSSSKTVHGIYTDPITGVKGDPFADYRLVGELMMERHFISDKSLSKKDDTYDAVPYIDYRLTGKIYNDVLKYFSGYPRNEHAAYYNRPEPPYPYDRQWRIGGYRAFERDSFRELKEEYGDSFEMELTPGAQIQELAEYATGHSFLYLQNEWNGYNRIHWSVDSGKNTYLCLSARKNVMGSESSPAFSVKTRNCFWHDGISLPNSIARGAWCIKYDGTLSDMIDMHENTDANGNSLFEEHEYYSFYLTMYTENSSGTITESGTAINSIQFSISRDAVSPATIINTDYDPWAKLLTINFRFDDALGRKYDIIGFKYTPVDYYFDASGRKLYLSENEFIVPDGDGDGTGVLIGNLQDLESNTPSETSSEFLITHSVQVSIDSLGITSTADMRVILVSALSENRKGLTLPEFTVKMWANEFLKPVEEQIMSLQGYRSHWKWEESYDEETGQVTGGWTYLEDDKAIPVMGKIQETKEAINDLSDAFESWYRSIAGFVHNTGDNRTGIVSDDMDAFEHWLMSSRWTEFYYAYFFQTFLNWHAVDGYKEEYAEYVENAGISECLPSTKARRWINAMGHEEEYKAWYSERRYHILATYRNTLSPSEKSGFSSSVIKAGSLSEFRIAFAKDNKDKYNEYYGIEESSSSSSEEEITDELALGFIEGSGRQKQFISYYSARNYYADSRFLERALSMGKVFGVVTYGVWEMEYEDAEYAGRYEEWLASEGASQYGNLNTSDKYQLFMITMTNSEKKTDIIPAGSETQPVDRPFSEETVIPPERQNLVTPENTGKSTAFSAFLQSPSGTGTTQSQRWQALNNTLAEQTEFLYRCLNVKNQLETDFRRNLIRQGFFSNGFVDNIPYNDLYSEESNMCFRWRVETRQYEGKMDDSEDPETGSYGSYDPRYKMYCRFQMDFFDTFDSQHGGNPVRDVIFIKDGLTEDCRILASIDDAAGSAGTTPYEASKEESSEYVPQRDDLVVDKTSLENSQSSKDSVNAKDLQLTATFGLPKEWLPRTEIGTILPEPWKQAWTTEEPRTEAPDDSSYSPRNIDYKSTYYWRVAPYNIVERPVFDAQLGSFSFSNEYGEWQAILKNVFHADEIALCRKDTRYAMLYAATALRDASNATYPYPVWKKNTESPVMGGEHGDQSQYMESTWLNPSCETRGEVQFLTDRPRKVDYTEQEETVVSDAIVESYFITNENGCRLENGFYGLYELIGNGSYASGIYANANDKYIYRAVRNGVQSWFISSDYPVFDGTDEYGIGILNENSSWDYTSGEEYLYAATCVSDTEGNEYRVRICANYGDNTSSTVMSTVATVSYINDNIGNFDTQWIPTGSVRRKPFAIRFASQYLLFSNKQFGKVVKTVEQGGSVVSMEYKTNVITLSRGFASDVFGEESMCIPSYTVEKLGDYVYENIFIGGAMQRIDAVSVENPSLVKISDSEWRMYFNAVFFEGSDFVTRMYKADTEDFESWYGIEKVQITKDGTEKTGYVHPNAVAYYDEYGTAVRYDMFAVSEDHYSGDAGLNGLTTLKRLTSTDGTHFDYAEEIHKATDGYYNFCSPCLVEYDGMHVKLYFSIETTDESNPSSVIASIEGTRNAEGGYDWVQEEYLGYSRIILEKGNDEFIVRPRQNANVVEGKGRVFRGNMTDQRYYNPFVLHDSLNGCMVERLYYNGIESPYLWHDRILELAETLKETVIKTEYFEKYTWDAVYSYDILCAVGQEDWHELPVDEETGDTGYPASPKGDTRIKFSFTLRADRIHGIMMRMIPYAQSIRCLAQGEWIGYVNASNTQAVLSPETNSEADYSLDNYSPVTWIAENGVSSYFTEWLVQHGLHPETEEQMKAYAIEWLMETRNYPKYLWWSRKGAGIYRYVGYDILRNYSWNGDELQSGE